ncbi:hypothetical protein GCM10010317_067620 [Streptomyces mirabilis]|nr:hypothetical protein GCM10010317_067620 [Streptomyces mirabilis]
MGVPHKYLLDEPRPQQIDTRQLRVPPVPRPLLPRTCHAPILQHSLGEGPREAPPPARGRALAEGDGSGVSARSGWRVNAAKSVIDRFRA